MQEIPSEDKRKYRNSDKKDLSTTFSESRFPEFELTKMIHDENMNIKREEIKNSMEMQKQQMESTERNAKLASRLEMFKTLQAQCIWFLNLYLG